MDKETRDELIGRAIVLVIGMVTRIAWDLAGRVFDRAKKKKRKKKGD